MALLSASTTMSLLRVLTSFAAGSATILVLLALSAGLASGGLVRMLQQSSRYVSRVAGGIVVLSGLYMIVYWVPALGGGSNNRALAGKVMPTTACAAQRQPTGALHDLLDMGAPGRADEGLITPGEPGRRPRTPGRHRHGGVARTPQPGHGPARRAARAVAARRPSV